MSTSDATDFEGWLSAEFDATGAFTALVILVEIEGTRVSPLCSTYLNVIGAEVDWGEMTVLFAGSGRAWQGAAFFPNQDEAGRPLDNPTARIRLRLLEERVEQDRLVLNEGHFFDAWGRRMRIEETSAPA